MSPVALASRNTTLLVSASDRTCYVEVMDKPIPSFPRLTTNPDKLGGKPCIRGLRIAVPDVLRALATYGTRDALLADYPELEVEDLSEVLAFAAAMADWSEVNWRPVEAA